MRVMLVMWSDGSYGGPGEGNGPEDYAAWAEYDAALRSDGVVVDSGQFAEPEGDPLLVTKLTEEHGDPDSGSVTAGGSALSGYYLLEVDDLEAARAYARRAPLYGAVEVRPLLEY